MSKRIEQSRRHGHFDPRWTNPLRLVTDDQPPVPDEIAVLIELPVPHLKLVEEPATEEDAAVSATPR